jgi:hypothetical protein
MLILVNKPQDLLHLSQANSTRIRIMREKQVGVHHQHVTLLLLLALPHYLVLVLHPHSTQ